MSPGHSAGTMLAPCTLSRTSPKLARASCAKSRWTASRTPVGSTIGARLPLTTSCGSTCTALGWAGFSRRPAPWSQRRAHDGTPAFGKAFGGRRLRPCRRSLLFRPLLPHVEPSSRNYSPSGAVLCSPFWRQALLFSAVRVVPARRWVSKCRSSWCSILLRLGAIPGRSGVNMRGVVLAVVVLLAVLPLGSQLGKPVPVSVVTDWSSRHVLFPQSKSISKAAATSPPSRSGSRC